MLKCYFVFVLFPLKKDTELNKQQPAYTFTDIELSTCTAQLSRYIY